MLQAYTKHVTIGRNLLLKYRDTKDCMVALERDLSGGAHPLICAQSPVPSGISNYHVLRRMDLDHLRTEDSKRMSLIFQKCNFLKNMSLKHNYANKEQNLFS